MKKKKSPKPWRALGRHALDAPLTTGDDQVLTFFAWCQLNRISERTGRRILAAPGAPVGTELSQTNRHHHRQQQALAAIKSASVMSKIQKIGDAIYVTVIKIFTGTEDVFYWVELPCHPERMTEKMRQRLMRKFIATPAVDRHGPFRSEAECDKDQERVLLGPDCVVTKGEGFPQPGNDTVN